MKRIAKPIYEDNSDYSNVPIRKTARAIIFEDDKILLVYSKMFNDYTIPGGGIKDGENPIEALERELREELGAINIDIWGEYGYTEEYRYSYKNEGEKIKQISYYYFVNINEYGEQQLIESEKIYGVEPRLITFEEAIKHNETVINDEIHLKKGLKTVIPRENMVLSILKDFEILSTKKVLSPQNEVALSFIPIMGLIMVLLRNCYRFYYKLGRRKFIIYITSIVVFFSILLVFRLLTRDFYQNAENNLLLEVITWIGIYAYSVGFSLIIAFIAKKIKKKEEVNK